MLNVIPTKSTEEKKKSTDNNRNHSDKNRHVILLTNSISVINENNIFTFDQRFIKNIWKTVRYI